MGSTETINLGTPAMLNTFEHSARLSELLAQQATEEVEGGGIDNPDLYGRIAARNGKSEQDGCDAYEPFVPRSEQCRWVQEWIEGNDAEWDLINAERGALEKGAA